MDEAWEEFLGIGVDEYRCVRAEAHVDRPRWSVRRTQVEKDRFMMGEQQSREGNGVATDPG